MDKVEYALLEGHRVIVGPGIDHVLEGINTILLLDDYYADIYGDYIFLGYNAYHVPVDPTRADLVNLYNAAQILAENHSVIVCGENPERCIYTIAAYLVYTRGVEPRRAVEQARSILRQIYPGHSLTPKSKAALAALQALYRGVRMLGSTRLSILMSLAANYGWGWSDIHYSEHVSWTAALEADDPTLLASMLHFLTEGPGSEEELLKIRLETIGEEELRKTLDSVVDEALEALRLYAKGSGERRAALLRFVELLEPGKGYILLAALEEGKPTIYCAGGEGIPSRECMERVQKAAGLAKEVFGEEPRVRIADWL